MYYLFLEDKNLFPTDQVVNPGTTAELRSAIGNKEGDKLEKARLSLRLIQVYIVEGALNDALKMVYSCEGQLVFQDNEDLMNDLLLAKAMIWHRIGNQELAIQNLEMAEVLSEPKLRAWISLLKAKIHADNHQWKSAVAYAKKVLYASVPENTCKANAAILIASIYLLMQEADKAIKYFDRAAEMDSDNQMTSSILAGRASAYALRGDYRLSAEYFTKINALRIERPSLKLRMLEAQSKYLSGQQTMALEIIEECLKEYRPDTRMLIDCLRLKRMILKQMERYSEAEETLELEMRIKKNRQEDRLTKKLSNIIDTQQEEVIQLNKELNNLAHKGREILDMHVELEKFAHITSHFVREPLRSISSFSSILQARYGKKGNSEFDFYLSQIKEGVISIDLLLRDLLRYVSVGEKKEMFEATDLNLVVEETVKKMKVSLEENNAKLEISDMPYVMANRSMMQLLFQNLINNAVKYRSSADPFIKISSIDQGDSWRIEVQDNGLGIAPAYHKKIFKLFSRIDKTKKDGTGIGLATCKKVVSAHGGMISLESDEGKGSTFYFTLPKLSA